MPPNPHLLTVDVLNSIILIIVWIWFRAYFIQQSVRIPNDQKSMLPIQDKTASSSQCLFAFLQSLLCEQNFPVGFNIHSNQNKCS